MSAYVRRAAVNGFDINTTLASLATQLQQDKLGGIIFFCSPKYDLEQLAMALKQQFDCPLLGCTADNGLGLGEQHHDLVALSLSANMFHMHVRGIEQIDKFTAQQAQQLVNDIQTQLAFSPYLDHEKMFVFSLIDGLSQCEEHMVSFLYHALQGIPLIGGSASDHFTFTKTAVFAGDRFCENAAALALIETKLPFEVFKFQHMQPLLEQEMVVTDADPKRRIVYEINGEIAAKEYADLIQISPDQLTPAIFSKYPLMLQMGDDWFARAAGYPLADGSLQFYCAIEAGIPLTLAKTGKLVSTMAEQFSTLKQSFQEVVVTLGCDCVFRQLELSSCPESEQANYRQNLQNMNFVGFSTYGEQINGVHVNQTMTGIVLGLK